MLPAVGVFAQAVRGCQVMAAVWCGHRGVSSLRGVVFCWWCGVEQMVLIGEKDERTARSSADPS